MENAVRRALRLVTADARRVEAESMTPEAERAEALRWAMQDREAVALRAVTASGRYAWGVRAARPQDAPAIALAFEWHRMEVERAERLLNHLDRAA